MKYITSILIMSFLSFLSASENYFEIVGKHFKIDPKILYAIAKHESNLNPYALNYNKNGTYDVGLMQINTIHLDTLNNLGYKDKDLWNPKVNIYMGALVLSKCFKKYGVTINGITCYNGRISNNPYGYKVIEELKKLYKKS